MNAKTTKNAKVPLKTSIRFREVFILSSAPPGKNVKKNWKGILH